METGNTELGAVMNEAQYVGSLIRQRILYLFVFLVVAGLLVIPAVFIFARVDTFILETLGRGLFFLGWFAQDGMGYLHSTTLLFCAWGYLALWVAGRVARLAVAR